jgi:hypothetical protein
MQITTDSILLGFQLMEMLRSQSSGEATIVFRRRYSFRSLTLSAISEAW